jgi:hypothetical protein
MNDRSIELTVGQITHSTIKRIEKSCDRFCLRVKRETFLSCSIDWLARQSARRRSRKAIRTQLTTDSHSRRLQAEDDAPKQTETNLSGGRVPSEIRGSSTGRLERVFQRTQSAAHLPALFLRVHPGFLRTRRAEFISVSGQCAARSALSSDMRIFKRLSGGVAATEHLHAPMNSPRGVVPRVSFSPRCTS